MTQGSRVGILRIAAMTAIAASLVAVTIVRPSWPRDVWLMATTRNIPFEFSSQGMCEERDAYQPDQISIGSDRRTIEGFVSINCADKPGNPTASQRGDTIFLRVRALAIDPGSGLSAACYCSNKVKFSLQSRIQPGQHVVLISDSFESARLVAP